MCLCPLIFAALATNLLELANAQKLGEPLPPYKLAATVTHVIPSANTAAGNETMEVGISDGSSPFCIRILSRAVSWPLAAGDTIRLHQTNSAEWAEYYDGATELVSRTSPRPLVLAEPDSILHGQHDYRVVRTHGLLRNIQISELNAEWVWIVLKCGRQNLYAATPTRPETLVCLKLLLDAEISIEGIVLPHDGSKRHHIGRVLHFAGPNAIEMLQRPPADFSQTPELEKIDNIPPSEIAGLPRHRVRGRILATWDRNKALLRTDRNKICRIEFQSETLPEVNAQIEAVGYPECDLQSINLSDAQWRAAPVPPATGRLAHTSEADAPPPLVTRLYRNCPFQLQHGSAIRMRGTVVTLPTPGVNDRILHVNCDGQIIPINAGRVPSPYARLQPGMGVEVTGICVNEVENYSSSRLFPCVTGIFLVIRNPSDIRIVSRPPWWTPKRMWSAIGILFAALVGILVWNMSLRKMAARKSRELFREQLGHVKADLRTEERTRLAVELHDTLAQNLTGVSMEIEAANDLRGEAPKPMLDHLGIAAKALKSCRDELRNCLWDLRSQALEETDMATAVLRTLQPHVNDSRLSVRFNVPRARLSDNTAHALLRVIRELVVNAIRHGEATSVKVAGAIDNGQLLCSVSDNGRGFDPDNAPGILQGHFGIQGIRERMDELGGTFEITSVPGRGTKAVITLKAPEEA